MRVLSSRKLHLLKNGDPQFSDMQLNFDIDNMQDSDGLNCLTRNCEPLICNQGIIQYSSACKDGRPPTANESGGAKKNLDVGTEGKAM
jgi:hypothetical protein